MSPTTRSRRNAYSSSSSESEGVSKSIPTLDQLNVEQWKHQMQIHLLKKGVWQFVGQAPADPKSEKVKLAQARALGMMYEHMSQGTAQSYMLDDSLASPHILWERILKDFSGQSTIRKHDIKRSIAMFKWKTNKVADEYNRFIKIMHEYESVGGKLEEAEKVEHFLTCVPRIYEHVVDNILAKPNPTLMGALQELEIKARRMKAARQLREADKERPRPRQGRAKQGGSRNKSTEQALYCTVCKKDNHSTKDHRYKNPNRRKDWKKNPTSKKRHDSDSDDANLAEEEIALITTDGDEQGLTAEFDDPRTWILDSGASKHMTAYKDHMEEYEDMQGAYVKTASGHRMEIIGKGKVRLSAKNGKGPDLVMHNVLHVPELNKSLFSVRQCTEPGNNTIEFMRNQAVLKHDGKTILTVPRTGKLYAIKNEDRSGAEQALNVEDRRQSRPRQRLTDSEKHLRTAHVYASPQVTCESCLLGRITRQVAKRYQEAPTHGLLELIHSDVAQLPAGSLGGSRYMVTFIDDWSRYTTLYFMKKKSEVFQRFKDYVAEAERQTGAQVRKLRDDKGSEYISNAMKTWMKERGIIYQETHKAAPYENAVAERYNRTIFDKVRTNLVHANQQHVLWAECAATVNYCKNRIQHSKTKCVPYERWTGNPPMLEHMKQWGQRVIFHVQNRDKLQPKGKRGIFVGYNATNTKGYRIYDPHDNKIVLTKDVIFLTKRAAAAPEYINPNPHDDEDANDEYAIYASPNEDKDIHQSLGTDPKSYREAIASENKERWKEAMESEWNALKDNETFEIVKARHGIRPVGCRWVFKTKLKADGTIERYKARLVARGFSQRPGIDFFETFAPVARLESIRIILAIAVSKGYKIYQADVKNAYLNGTIDTEIYMDLPEGYLVEGKMLRLKKGLYGLKQAGRLWYNTFDEFMKAQKYTNLRSDPCIYKGNNMVIILYVDDIIMCGTYQDIHAYMTQAQATFKMQDFKQLEWFLGISVKAYDTGIKLSQELYITKILQRFNMTDCKPHTTPESVTKTDSDECLKTNIPYRELVGSLMYLANATRPDIAQSVGKLAQNVSNPTAADWTAGKRIMRYLQGTRHLALHIQQQNKEDIILAYADASYGTARDRKSVSGQLVYIHENLVTWNSRKHVGDWRKSPIESAPICD